MTPAFLRCCTDVLQVEAGYQCDKADRGNWSGGSVGVGNLVGTNRGISAPVLADWRKRPITTVDMRALTKEEALAIYEVEYWSPLHADELPLPIAYVCFDAEVMSGLGSHLKHRTGAWLQSALGIQVDDQIGPQTIAAAKASDIAAVVKAFTHHRLAFLKSLPDWPHFPGWGTRVLRVQTVALSLLEP